MKKSILILTAVLFAWLLFACQNSSNNVDKEGVVGDSIDGANYRTLEEVPAFMYHSIRPSDEVSQPSSMVVSKENFEKDLIYLAKKGYTAISLSELMKHYEDPEYELPEKPVIITFDDGYEDNYLHAFPLLEKYQAKATIFTIVWSVGRDKFILNDDPINPHFTWEEGREMVENGLVEIGSHTFDLHNQEGFSYGYGEACGYGLARMAGEKTEDYRKRIGEDLKKSKDLIEENIGREALAFAYPYGLYNKEIIDIAREAGFKLAFITESQVFSSSPYEIRRFTVKEDVRVSDILGKLGE